MRLTSAVVSIERLPHFVKETLKPQLPYSLPLYRRCQYHATRSSRAPHAEIWMVTAGDQSSPGLLSQQGEPTANQRDRHHWLAAYIDLSNSGQTQVWTFASWEADLGASADPASAVRELHDYPIFAGLFNALFSHIRKKHVPKLSQDPPAEWQKLKDSGKIVSLPFSRSKVLFGTLAECHWFFLDDYPTTGGQGVSRADKGYLKHIFRSEASSLVSGSPPDTLYFAPMEEKHLQIILDRTNIPRTIETVRQLHRVGLFNEDKVPIAWGMLSKDGSISSLHTEPEYRGKGLAEVVSRRLFADQLQIFMDDTDPGAVDTVVYCHADVSAANHASTRVMEKLGGKVMWKVAWIEVELGEETP